MKKVSIMKVSMVMVSVMKVTMMNVLIMRVSTLVMVVMLCWGQLDVPVPCVRALVLVIRGFPMGMGFGEGQKRLCDLTSTVYLS